MAFVGCGILDINGAKGPNMWGYDFNEVVLVKNNGEYKIVPFGSDDDNQTCSAGSGGYTTSNGCATNALLDTLP